MQDYREKRDLPRMQLDCPAQLEMLDDGATGTATVHNLSGGGMLITFNQMLEVGRMLRVRIEPSRDVTPPMVADVRVLRCDPQSDGDGRYAVAGEITRILD